MVDRQEAERRKALRRAAEARQRASREAALPLPKKTLWALFDHLEDALADGRDHSLRFTRQFLASRGIEPDLVLPWLEEHGGYCDCEVLANVEEHWERP